MDQTNHIPESILEKLRKLLRLKDSAEKIGSMAEATNAAEKIQDLLLKYNLELSQVREEEAKSKEPITSKIIRIRWEYSFFAQNEDCKWVMLLSTVLCDYNMCMGLADQQRDIVIINGTETNCEIVKSLLDFLVEELQRLAFEAFNLRVDEYNKAKVIFDVEGDNYWGKTEFQGIEEMLKASSILMMKEPQEEVFYPNFYRGAVMGIHNALDENYKRFMHENHCTGLMTTHKEAVMEYAQKTFKFRETAKGDKEHPPIINPREMSLQERAAMSAGFKAGMDAANNQKKIKDEN